ncbi:MAG TPA: DUF4921 family protein [Thermoanaerobaculia bacterium]|nr:DUF4921 family protein [Thermoanaerobaculia bacterium]
MTSYRRHLITGDPIVFAPERAARPGAFTGSAAEARCPFCPGHEADTPPQIAQLGDPWRVRVVPNKYPPTGGAEVIVESNEHDAAFEHLPHAEELVRLYADRSRAHAEAAHVALFKNEGTRAGSSIAHVHSQLIPTPFVPLRIEREAAAFARAAHCPLCEAIETHRREELVIAETPAFVWLAPSASWMAYQQWLVPKRHVASLTELDDTELAELGALLRSAASAMRTTSDSFNWSFTSFSRAPAAHFYVDLFPRVTTIAGFELGTGTFVEIIDPAAAARRLRLRQ